MPSRADVGIGMLGLAETIGTYGNLCPTVDALRDKLRDGNADDLRDDLTNAYIRSGILSLIIAGGAGLLTHSFWPLAGWGVGLVAATATYESLLPAEQRLLNPASILRLANRDPNIIEAQYRVVS